LRLRFKQPSAITGGDAEESSRTSDRLPLWRRAWQPVTRRFNNMVTWFRIDPDDPNDTREYPSVLRAARKIRDVDASFDLESFKWTVVPKMVDVS